MSRAADVQFNGCLVRIKKKCVDPGLIMVDIAQNPTYELQPAWKSPDKDIKVYSET